MEKIKLFSHNDLDGVGCGILASLYVNQIPIDIEYCNYDNINEKVLEFYNGEDINEHSMIFITDISIDKNTANVIENYRNKNKYPQIQLIDHHQTAMWLNKYDWALVEVEFNGIKQSGTNLFYDYIKDELFCDYHQQLKYEKFAEIIRQYDTWDWVKNNNQIPKQLNDLLYIKGRKRFIEDVMKQLQSNIDLPILNEFDIILLEIEEEKKQKYFEDMSKNIIERNILQYNVGIVFANQYISELGNWLSKNNLEYDLIAIIDNDTISYRTIKNNVDVSLFAKHFGGGGHKQASGSLINNNIINNYIDMLFKLSRNKTRI